MYRSEWKIQEELYDYNGWIIYDYNGWIIYDYNGWIIYDGEWGEVDKRFYFIN
ncbi:hypothetical protein [Bacillus wiedmannii]|uniref:hypothetical protein n=1 Tax=Bacillus wiedmannii TaxID=1890302 RepID=UPI000A62C8E2|nr:hypothetical protein [Bacillus wiedmannii]